MNFKKHISIFVAFFLLVSNVGMAFNVHYCGKAIASVSIKTVFENHNPEKKCCGEIEKKSHCCKNKTVHFQKKSDVSILKSLGFQNSFLLFNQISNPIIACKGVVLDNTFLKFYFCDAHAPPLFKLYSQFIFYS